MLILIITVLLFAVIFCWQLINFRRIYFADKALFGFRELRYKSSVHIMQSLNTNISLKEIEDHYDFLDNVNGLIVNYNQVLPHMVKFRHVKEIYIKIMMSSNKLRRIENEHSESLLPYKIEFTNNIKILFEAIPFYRVRLIFSLIKLILQALVFIGFSKVRRTLDNLYRMDQINNHLNNGCTT